jgi:hypothetical protein
MKMHRLALGKSLFHSYERSPRVGNKQTRANMLSGTQMAKASRRRSIYQTCRSR